MPKWTPELDAIVLRGVFEECNVSFGKELCAKISQRVVDIGIECTPKAVENRLYSWKKKNTAGGATNPTSSATGTPAKPASATQKTPRSRNKATPRAKKEEDGDDGEEPLSPTPAPRKRKSSAPKKASSKEKDSGDDDIEEDDFPKSKKVKAEPSEEGPSGGEDVTDEDI
ncbi:hypothetical protein ACJQWK_09165 [Exserohilum turcicum]|uniref:Uncharacterized protein n=1 Tax=Exserohilum turcicum (strain 28A) TaxID=671987 RepID=R0IY82_EXST2|nr:uncharacterized protein SETTUDRAFT_105487 [Exserohilum turcica Et28A]EOA89516.1 hypothetical protein SETTUDRAFT_105487 [Exserohilum turcica Et28A]